MPTGPAFGRPDDRLCIEPGISRFRVRLFDEPRNGGSPVPAMEPKGAMCFILGGGAGTSSAGCRLGRAAMSLGTILIILVILYLLGGFSGRFGGYGYGMGHSGMGLGGVILVVLIILLLLGKL
jgi:hypothetical protein